MGGFDQSPHKFRNVRLRLFRSPDRNNCTVIVRRVFGQVKSGKNKED